MPNNLTGDYEAVFQLSVEQINYMLGTMHQNKQDASAAGLPSFEHSTGPISVRQQSTSFEKIAALSKWLADEAQKTDYSIAKLIGFGDSGNPKQGGFLKTGLIGVDKIFEDAVGEWGKKLLGKVVIGKVSGNAYMQLAPPRVAFADGATSAVTVFTNIRAVFYPKPGTPVLPAPIHGDVKATYLITMPAGGAVRIQVSNNDNDITFTPAPGTISAADAQDVAEQIRTLVRGTFIANDVPLPGNFPFPEFVALGGGTAIALPFQPSGAPFPSGSIQGLTNQFLAGSDFGAALSKEYAQSLFKTMLDQLTASVKGLTFTVAGKALGFSDSVSYSVSLSALDLNWKSGEIDLSGKIHAHNDVLPDCDVDFTQGLNVVLDVPSQTLSIQAAGDPVVTGSSLIVGTAADAIKTQRDAALPNASASLQTQFSQVGTKFRNGFDSFDHYVANDFRFTSVEITPDGLILRGKLGGAGRIDPIVDYKQTGDGSAFTAFQSWIPGGQIDQFVWTWTEGHPWMQSIKSSVQPHQYTFPTPAAVATTGRVCLQIEGSRQNADDSVVAGTICKPSWSEPILEVPAWLVRILVPFWAPDPPDDQPLENGIAGHINMAGQSSSPRNLKPNYLVHFTGDRYENRLSELGEAMAMSQRQTGSVVMMLVFPTGTFRMSARELETKLGPLTERFNGRLLITEDYLEGWTSAFSVSKKSSTFLIGADRKLAWKQEGKFDGRALSEGLAKHLVAAPARASVPMELNVRVGERAFDARFETDGGENLALHRLIGKRVILNFWQSWSAPCLRELRYLERLRKAANTVVLAVNGGDPSDVLPQFRRDNALTIPFVHDANHMIAARYGVQCWPTTIFINPGSTVDRIQFGVSDDEKQEPAHAAD